MHWEIWLEGNCITEGDAEDYDEANLEADEAIQDDLIEWREIGNSNYYADDYEVKIMDGGRY